MSGIIKSIKFTGNKELIKAIQNFQTKEITEVTASVCFLYALITLQKGNVLSWKHVLLHGIYDLSYENNRDEFDLVNPKIVALIYSKFGESQITT